MFLSLSYRILHNSSASALTEPVKPGHGNQTLIICPWISILHHRLLCKRFVFDEVTLIYNIHHHYCASSPCPGRLHIQHAHLLHDKTACFSLHAEAVSVWRAQSRLRAGGREEDSSTAKHQNGVDRRATVQNIVIHKTILKMHFENKKKHKWKWAGRGLFPETHQCTEITNLSPWKCAVNSSFFLFVCLSFLMHYFKM